MRESGRFVQAAHQKTKPTVGGFLPEAPCRGSATVWCVWLEVGWFRWAHILYVYIWPYANVYCISIYYVQGPLLPEVRFCILLCPLLLTKGPLALGDGWGLVEVERWMTPPVWWLRSLSGQCLKGTSVTSCFVRWGQVRHLLTDCRMLQEGGKIFGRSLVSLVISFFRSGFHPVLEHSMENGWIAMAGSGLRKLIRSSMRGRKYIPNGPIFGSAK